MSINIEKIIEKAIEKAITGSGDSPTPTTEGHPFQNKQVLVRCRNAGVHYGKLVGTDGFVTLEGSHRIWSWEGAFTLSEVSQKGVSQARVACEVPYLSIPMQDVAELIPMTTAAETSLAAFVA